MERSVLWREARRQWRLLIHGPLLVLGVGLWAFWQVKSYGGSLRDLCDTLPGAVEGLGWPTLAALAGAAAFAGEPRDRLTRAPLRDGFTRLSIGYLYAALIAMFLFGLAGLGQLRWGSSDGIASFYFGIAWLRGGFYHSWGLSAAISLMCLGAGAASWSLLRRVLPAAGLALALVGLPWFSFWWIGDRIRVVTDSLSPPWLAASVAGVGFLWVLVAVVLQAAAPRRLGGWRWTLPPAGVVLAWSLTAVTLSGLIYAALPPLSLDSENVFLLNLDVNPTAGAILATAVHPEGWSPQVWRIALDGSGGAPFRPRMTYWPQWSPDGQWILYRSERGFLGLLAPESIDVRAVRPDGSEDHLVGTGGLHGATWNLYAPEGPAFRFHQTTSRIMIWGRDGQIALFDLEKPVDRRLPMGRVSRVTWLGWSSDASAVVLAEGVNRGGGWEREGAEVAPPWRKGVYVSGWIPPPTPDFRSRIWAQQFADGTSEILFETDERVSFFAGHAVRASAVRFVPFLVEDRESDAIRSSLPDELRVVDLETGDVARLGRTSCTHRSRLSQNGRTLVYGLCPEKKEGEWIELRLRDLETGEDRRLARLEEPRRRLIPSPSGRRVLRRGSPLEVILEDGSILEPAWEEEWRPVTWIDEDSLLLRSDTDGTTSLAIGDLDGNVDEIFP